jgi:hypothetical protein
VAGRWHHHLLRKLAEAGVSAINQVPTRGLFPARMDWIGVTDAVERVKRTIYLGDGQEMGAGNQRINGFRHLNMS